MTADTAFDAARIAKALVALRPTSLLFSVPYLWAWTADLPAGGRVPAVVAHALAVLAAGAMASYADARDGLPLHLSVAGGTRVADVGLARLVASPLAVVAVLASLPLRDLSATLPAAAALSIAAAAAWTLLPVRRRYFLLPDLAIPLLVVVVPAALLRLQAGAGVPVDVVVAATCFLAALVLAAHIRDRGRDLRDEVPTSATRNLPLARGWMLTLAFSGTIAALASLTLPLAGADVLRAGGALAFGVFATISWRRVVTLTVTHALFAVSILL